MSGDLSRSSIPTGADTVLSAARGIVVVTGAPLVALVALLLAMKRMDLAALSMFLVVILPMLSREVLLSYPRIVASKKGAQVARSSTDDLTLIIMSLRHEPSLPKAMALAASRSSDFAAELRESIWSVISGVHSTFEEALHDLAKKWAGHCGELKPAVRAMITASCEATEAGRRRALDRANDALVTGAKCRIEEYTLSLSVPSMILFGIGILLPMMVGSFLPMLSWDIWTVDSMQAPPSEVHSGGIALQTVVLMNIVFPAVALLVALDAVSKHPMARPVHGDPRYNHSRLAAEACAALSFSLAGLAASHLLLDGPVEYVLCVLSVVVPASLLLTVHGSGTAPQGDRDERERIEDLLFSAGARLVDGENLEIAMHGARIDRNSHDLLRQTGNATHVQEGCRRAYDEWSNEERALGVVTEAASKDESQAGILAMDLAGYVREVAELEAVLKRRLKPTLSMMRLTTHALAPIMLGVTHTIYGSLTSIGGGASGLSPGALFAILAAFLVEINIVVAYFAWGIGEQRRLCTLAYSIGSCMLVAVLILSAVVLATL
ncbi:MAG: hypothetical protein OEM29_02145 [Thermoplasmata archaeon]|nr:hypothetical protein [Thermoplasmata archaeon]